MSRLFKENSTHTMVAFMSLSNIFTNIVSMSAGLLVAKWLLPEQLGFFSGFSIITSYIILAQLGIPSGLSRELPLFMGSGEDSKAKELASVANFYELCLGSLIFLVSVLISITLFFLGNSLYGAGMMVVGFTSFQGVYVTKYLKVLYRSNNDFNKLSVISIITCVTAAVSVLFVWKFGFYGLCLRASAMFLVDFYFTWKWRPIDVPPIWDKVSFRELLKVGMPIYWVANIYSLWPVLQRTVIISCLGVKAMGLYALAMMVDKSMQIITNSLASVTFPKMSSAWGQGETVKQLIKKPTKIIMAIFGINICIALGAWFAIPVFVEYFLENYVEGIKAAQWMALVGCINVFSVYGNVYMVIQRNMDRLVSYIIGVVVWGVTFFILMKHRGFDLEIMPQSILLAYIAMYAVNVFHFNRYVKMDLKHSSFLRL